MTKLFVLTTSAALVVFSSTACATKNFVRQGIKPVNDKVDSLGQSVESTQETIRKHEGQLDDVDKKTQAAQSSADQAQQAALAAGNDAKGARARADEVGAKADEFDKNSRRLVYTVVLSEDEGQFKSGKSSLP